MGLVSMEPVVVLFITIEQSYGFYITILSGA